MRRLVTIGGSEAAAACGVDPYTSRRWLYLLKRGEVEPAPATEAMGWGTRLEHAVADELTDRGFKLTPADELRDGFMVGHPDRYVELDGEAGVLDIKCVGLWQAASVAADEAIPAHVIQLHHYLYLSGRRRGLLAYLVGGQRLELRTVDYDERLAASMIEAETDFVGMVQRGERPAPNGTDSAGDALLSEFPGVAGRTVRLTGEALQAVKDARLWREARDRAGERYKQAAQVVQDAMGDATIAVSPGDAVLAHWTPMSRSAVDTTALKERAPHVAAQYTKTTTTRRFTLA